MTEAEHGNYGRENRHARMNTCIACILPVEQAASTHNPKRNVADQGYGSKHRNTKKKMNWDYYMCMLQK